MFTRLKEFCFNISTYRISAYQSIGEWKTGSLIASLFAIPLIYLLRGFYSLNPKIFYTIILIITTLTIVIIQGALRHITDKNSSTIVIDKTFGFALVFLGIAFNMKLIIVGLFIFHILNFLYPLLISKFCKIDLNNLPGALSIIIPDIIAGLSVNLFFRFTMWLTL